MGVLRFMGKKQLGELQPSELVTTILISNIATISLEDPNLPMISGIIPIMLIVALDIILSVISLKKEPIRRLLAGSPKYIVKDGVIDRAEMTNLRYTLDDLFEAMHEDGIFDIADVNCAVVETTGKINFLLRSGGTAPGAVIKDGVIDPEELSRIELTESDIRKILTENCAVLSDIYLLSATNADSYNIILKDTK
jgi:uncharacterized membrane protein YcaP (DUF421 family)